MFLVRLGPLGSLARGDHPNSQKHSENEGANENLSCGQERRSSLNITLLGGIFLRHQGPRRRDIPDKNFMQVAFVCCFRQGVAGMSRDLGRDVPDLEKLHARKLWAAFSFPTRKNTGINSIVSEVVYKCSSRGSSGFRGSRGFQCEKWDQPNS